MIMLKLPSVKYFIVDEDKKYVALFSLGTNKY